MIEQRKIKNYSPHLAINPNKSKIVGIKNPFV